MRCVNVIFFRFMFFFHFCEFRLLRISTVNVRFGFFLLSC